MMHDSDEYGILRCPLTEIAQAIGHPVKLLRELHEKGVLKGAERGERIDAFIYTPRHAGKDGEPVTLLPVQEGPIWYSSRMVRDEYIRSKRGEGTRFGDSPKGEPKDTPKPSPTQREGDGPSSSSSSSTSEGQGQGLARPPGPPDCPHEAIVGLYHELLPDSPRILEWTEARRGCLRARWREMSRANGVGPGYANEAAGIEWWRTFFSFVAESKFLTGKTPAREGKPPFVADLEWLIKPSNFVKVIEGRYRS